jgi:hypothetical protein
MYTTHSHQGHTTSDLAARLTDVGLEALAGATTSIDSVALELRLWHALEAELERDRRWQHFIPRREEVAPMGRVLQQIVSRATQRLERADEYLCPV